MAVMFRKTIKIQDTSTGTDFCDTAVCHVSLTFQLKTRKMRSYRFEKKNVFLNKLGMVMRMMIN